MKVNTPNIPANTLRTIWHKFRIIITEKLCSAYRFFSLVFTFLEDILLFLEDMLSTTPPHILRQNAMKLAICNYIITKYKKNLSILTKK